MNSGDDRLPLDPSAVPPYGDLLSLEGQGAIVGGAGTGMGRQIAHALASVGATVVCADIDGDVARQTAAEVGGVGVAADLTDAAGVSDVIAFAREQTVPLKTIVDLVGGGQFGSLVDFTDEDWVRQERGNLRHAFHFVRLGGQALIEEGGGAMAFVASTSGQRGAQLHAAYGAFKGALIALVRGAAVELGPYGVRVNSVSPGAIWTPRLAGVLGDSSRPKWDALFPAGRVGLPRDIGAAMLFLVSDLAAFVSGQDITVDAARGQMHPYPMDEVVLAAQKGQSPQITEDDDTHSSMFAVRLERGGPWDWSRERHEQDGWDEHAQFMDSLVDDGFIILGGPITGERENLHVVSAPSEQAVRERLAEDNWSQSGMLTIKSIEHWTILLDGRTT